MINWVELSHRSSCPCRVVTGGRVVSWVKLSQRSSCQEGQVVSWVEVFLVELSQRVELSHGLSCPCRVVTWVEMTLTPTGHRAPALAWQAFATLVGQGRLGTAQFDSMWFGHHPWSYHGGWKSLFLPP